MKYTLNQLLAGIIAILLIVFLALVHFFPAKGTDDNSVMIAIIGALSVCMTFLFGSTSGSQSKDAGIASTTAQLVDALQNSTPVGSITAETLIEPVKAEPKD